MNGRNYFLFTLLLIIGTSPLFSQEKESASSLLTIDRIYNSGEFRQEWMGPTQWLSKGDYYTKIERSADGYDLVAYQSSNQDRKVLVNSKELTPKGWNTPIRIASYSWSDDEKHLLLFTNTKRVWRTNTKGDYWRFDRNMLSLKQVGADRPESSLMFAKFSPDNSQIAYVSEFNIYVEDFETGETTALTEDGNGTIINGTFDWVYEEEFSCQDGFRWSPDGKYIAFWQLDASTIRDFYMINTTDSIYPQIIPVQYPKVGEDPSICKVGVIDVKNNSKKWLAIPGDPVQHYIPRMQWISDTEVLVQQLNRKQNHLKVFKVDAVSGAVDLIYEEKEDTWVDIDYPDATRGIPDLLVINNGKSFLRLSENDGWRHIYRIDIDTKKKTVLTPGEYDVAGYYAVNEEEGIVYFNASPDKATQRYLHTIALDGTGKLNRLTPNEYVGVNGYTISPNGKYAFHRHSNANTPSTTRFVSLPNHKNIETLIANKAFKEKILSLDMPEIEFFTVTTEDGVEMDGKMYKPLNFDPEQKYPVLFHVYGEPWGAVANDTWDNRLWHAMMAQQGYIVIFLDNRGTPSLKGSEWRKSIYRKIGVVNARDQAMAAKKIKEWEFVDEDRIAVWGWSGGGSMTLNLMFQYPEIYKTGMSVAPVANQLYYDNVYQERYMGLPQENLEDFVKGSPITYAKNLEGNLLLIHGTGDDNVHYQNAEALINELIKHNKQFQVMPYPNRSHGIFEGANTTRHLYSLLAQYLRRMTPPGPKRKLP